MAIFTLQFYTLNIDIRLPCMAVLDLWRKPGCSSRQCSGREGYIGLDRGTLAIELARGITRSGVTVL